MLENQEELDRLNNIIDSVRSYLDSIISLGIIDAVDPKEVAVAKQALSILNDGDR